MIFIHKYNLKIEKESDVIFFSNRLKELATKIKLSLVSQTKLLTAVSELVRNILKYAKEGEVTFGIVSDRMRTGIQVIFKDKGPGIPDVKKAMEEGYTTEKGLGLGLPGARKLVDEFNIKSTVGKGTTIKILMWKHGR